jgi:hypothetical protein
MLLAELFLVDGSENSWGMGEQGAFVSYLVCTLAFLFLNRFIPNV